MLMIGKLPGGRAIGGCLQVAAALGGLAQQAHAQTQSGAGVRWLPRDKWLGRKHNSGEERADLSGHRRPRLDSAAAPGLHYDAAPAHAGDSSRHVRDTRRRRVHTFAEMIWGVPCTCSVLRLLTAGTGARLKVRHVSVQIQADQKRTLLKRSDGPLAEVSPTCTVVEAFRRSGSCQDRVSYR